MSNVDKKTQPEKTAEVKTDDKAEKADQAKNKVEDPEEARKAAEQLDKKLQEIQKSVARFRPHIIPDWEPDTLKDRCAWYLQIFPVEQEDCKNAIYETATKIAYKALSYVPKHKFGQGMAELYMMDDNEAIAVMKRMIRMPFYHRYVTMELTRFSKDGKKTKASPKVAGEKATIVLDATKSGKIKNTTLAKEEKNNLWLRYVSENTSPEFLRIVFPFSKSSQIQTHDGVRLGLVEVNSKTDLQFFTKAYVTVIINDTNILSLSTREPLEKESVAKAELEKAVPPLADLKQAPTEVADKQNQRRDDKNETARILKRTMHGQQTGEQSGGKRGRTEPAGQRGSGANWGDQWSGQFGGRAGGLGTINARNLTAEMMMMQARLNQTLRNQLMMLSPSARRNFNAGFGGRFGGAGIRGVAGSKGFGGW